MVILSTNFLSLEQWILTKEDAHNIYLKKNPAYFNRQCNFKCIWSYRLQTHAFMITRVLPTNQNLNKNYNLTYALTKSNINSTR